MTNNILFKQLFEPKSCTYTYLIADLTTKRALIIDPVFDEARRDIALIREHGLDLVYCIETHIHADHVTSTHELKQAFKVKSVIPANSGGLYADKLIEDGESLTLDGITIKAMHTPGHTDHHMCYLWENKIFTGDALLINACGRTDFQVGDSAILFKTITQKLFTLPKNTIVYPAHDYHGLTQTTIGEQVESNPRFKDKTESEFIELMNNLNLPYPKRMITSVPNNLIAGNQDKQLQALKKFILPENAVLNLSKDLAFDTINIADKLHYNSWHIATPEKYHAGMEALVANRQNSFTLMKLKSVTDWQLDKSYDVIYAVSLFDELIESDISDLCTQLTQGLNDGGRFCLYSQWQNHNFATHTEINKIWRAINQGFGLKDFSIVNQSLQTAGLKPSAHLELEVGFYLSVWGKH